MSDSRGSSLLAKVVALVTLLMGIGVAYGFSQDLLPEVASKHGRGIDATINYLLMSTGAVYLIAHVFLAFFILNYSKDVPRAGSVVPPKTEAKFAIVPVLVMMVISEIGVLVVGLPVFAQIYGDPPEDAYQVEVVGKQFEWLVRYPGPDGVFGKIDAEFVHETRNPLGLDKKDAAAKDDIVKRGIVHVPLDRTTVVHLRSLDVLHSFTVPFFRTKQDTIPGFTARTIFLAEKAGEFELACAELCGLGHYRMQGTIVVQTEAELEKWLSEQEPWL